jgi:cell division transport system permease protein
VRAWLTQHANALRDALRRQARNPLATLLNVLVIGAALSMPVGLYLGLTQLQALSRQLSADPQVSLFLALDANTAEIADIEQRLRQHPEIENVRYLPKDSALADLKRTTDLHDVLDGLEHNPLPDAFVITVRENRPLALEAIRDEAAAWPKVAHVQLDSEWARKLYAALRVGRTLALLLGVLLSAALVAITFNTIRLQILTRREEIEVAKLIGATNGFIRRPFLYFGAVQGLVGGLAAGAVVAAALWFINRDLAELSALYAVNWRLQPLSARAGLILLALSAALGWLGAWLSVSRHLWHIDPR